MRKTTLVILAAALAVSVTHAGWWRTYGGEGYEMGKCIQIKSDGNYIISDAKNDSLWLIKTDTAGNMLWEKTYGESDGLRSRWLEETSDGGYIVAPGTPSLLKVNAQGDSLWAYDYNMYSHCVQSTTDDGYIVVGGDDPFGTDSYVILVKTNSLGDTLWTRKYGTPPDEHYLSIFVRETLDGGYIVTGRYEIYGDDEYFSVGLLLLKTDSLGDTLWTKVYGGTEYGEINQGNCVQQTNDRGYIVTGYNKDGELWLLKTDSIGDLQWTKTYSASSGGTGFCIQSTHDSGFIVVGTTGSFILNSNLVERDLWLLKIDEQGDTLWTRKYPGGGSEAIGYCLRQTEDSGYIVVGELNGDVYLLKTDSLGLLSVEETPIAILPANWEMLSSLGPNTVIRYWRRPQGLTVTIYDASGRKVDEVRSEGSQGSITWPVTHRPSGVYFIKVEGDNSQAQKVVLVR